MTFERTSERSDLVQNGVEGIDDDSVPLIILDECHKVRPASAHAFATCHKHEVRLQVRLHHDTGASFAVEPASSVQHMAC